MGRISERLRYDQTNTRIDRARRRNTEDLDKMTSMKRINEISDDPVGHSRALRSKDRISMMKQYQKNMQYANSYLERTESAIKGIHDNLIRARELAVGMANDTYGADARDAAGKEIGQIIKSVMSLANTKFANRYIFSGFRTNTPALSIDGKYLGDDGAIFVATGEGKFSQINLQPRLLFEPSVDEQNKKLTGLMDSLNTLHKGLTDNDKSLIYKSMDQIDNQLSKASSFQAEVGGLTKSFDDQIQRLELDSELTLKSVSEIEDTDMFETTSTFKRSETVLQSTLLASNKLLQPSLLNFLQ